MSALIEFEQVCKYYQMGDTLVKAADHITMKIEKGEFVAIVGQSGRPHLRHLQAQWPGCGQDEPGRAGGCAQ